MKDRISIKNASQHNLKNVSLDLPKNELIVFTGISGSGKSSLAFDTIFAEGQRRYVESLSVYARQFLGQLDKPDVESIEGLSPAIAVDQKSAGNNPRSTVGTITEIYDYLRLLFARAGTPHCPECGSEIAPQSIDEIVDKICALPAGTKIQITAPVIRGKKGEFAGIIEELRQEGFIRARIDGEIYNLDEDEIKLAKTKKHTIEAVVDRLIIKDGIKSRLTDSVQTALKKSDGLLTVNIQDGKEMIFSEKLACPNCSLSFEELEPRIFSFNNPYGACPACSGLGAHYKPDENLLIPDRTKSLKQGAVYPWAKTGNPYYTDILSSVSKHFGIDMDCPFEDLPEEHKNIILYGSKEPVTLRYKEFGTEHYITRRMPFAGIIPYFMKKYEDSNSEEIRAQIQDYMSKIPCSECSGARLMPFVLAVTIAGRNIYDICKMSIKDAYAFFSDLPLELDDYKLAIAKQIIDELRKRLKFMLDVGLDYLDLARSSSTLSGGEAQRIRLAAQIGSGLSGVLYVLDEPSIGLHQYNNDMLIKTLFRLRNLGNTLIVVEHDEDTIRSADHIVDIGVFAGVNGGNIIAQGNLEDIEAAPESLTGQYLSGKRNIPVPKKHREGNGCYLEIVNAHKNNLKNINVKIPLGKITALTGISGSGKSTLMNDILYEYSLHKLFKNKAKPQGIGRIDGFENIDKVINIDQQPIGRTPRSNPATYTDVFTPIRELFAKTNEAKMRGYTQGRFSFNIKGGRCEACQGGGVKRIEMDFLSDVYVKCDVCKGNRYNRETLEVKYKGKNISEVLEMNISDALDFFDGIPKIKTRLQTLNDAGLGYMKLGQSSLELSGGEAQRIKLAAELNKRSTGKTLYLLDEPSTGLHWYDLDKLTKILNRLADSGNTILVIEHNLDFIKTADHIIDLGLFGGDAGGEVIAEGTPEEIAANEKSLTGRYLKKMLEC